MNPWSHKEKICKRFWWSDITNIFSCDQAALRTPLSVCLSHLFHYVPVIVSSWNFQELLTLTKVMSMHEVKVRGQRSRSHGTKNADFDPNWAFPDCNSSLNLPMATKWCTKLEVGYERCPIVFKVIRQISRSHGSKNRPIWPRLGVSGP